MKSLLTQWSYTNINSIQSIEPNQSVQRVSLGIEVEIATRDEWSTWIDMIMIQMLRSIWIDQDSIVFWEGVFNFVRRNCGCYERWLSMAIFSPASGLWFISSELFAQVWTYKLLATSSFNEPSKSLIQRFWMGNSIANAHRCQTLSDEIAETWCSPRRQLSVLLSKMITH